MPLLGPLPPLLTYLPGPPAPSLARSHPPASVPQLSEALHAAQIVVEDHYLSNLHLHPLTVVGVEGVLGVATMLAVVLPLAQRLPGSDGKVGGWCLLGLLCLLCLLCLMCLLLSRPAGIPCHSLPPDSRLVRSLSSMTAKLC